MDFPARLKVLIGSRTQEEFAKLVGDDQQKLSKYLNSVQKPGHDFLKRIAEAGYNVNWLLTGKGGMYISDAAATNVAPATMAVAEKLTRYPELASTLAEAIELREKLEGAKEELKAKLKYPKKR